jgi:SSS family solute:Na+ symporter
MGLMMSAYFSAILSTADSCLMAASGNFVTDVLGFFMKREKGIRFSQWVTLFIGAMAIVLATYMQNVLELMLYSYAFMVSGLLVPVLGMLYIKDPNPQAAIVSMILGGGVTIALIFSKVNLPFNLDENFFGISVSALSFVITHYFHKIKRLKDG